jgi:hypothetical protein
LSGHTLGSRRRVGQNPVFAFLPRILEGSACRPCRTLKRPSDFSPIRYLLTQPACLHVSVLQYYAILAYPKSTECSKRRSFIEAMAAMRFKEFAIQLGSRKNVPASYRRFKKEKMLCGIRLGNSRLQRRVSAALMAWGICTSGERYRYEAPTPDGKIGIEIRAPNSVKKAIELYLKNKDVCLEESSAAANVAHRIWAESFPVLHLAVTTPIVQKIFHAQIFDGHPPTSEEIAKDFFDSVHKPEWLPKALDDAEKALPILGSRLKTDSNKARDLGFNPEKVIRLLPTDDSSKAYRL